MRGVRPSSKIKHDACAEPDTKSRAENMSHHRTSPRHGITTLRRAVRPRTGTAHPPQREGRARAQVEKETVRRHGARIGTACLPGLSSDYSLAVGRLHVRCRMLVKRLGQHEKVSKSEEEPLREDDCTSCQRGEKRPKPRSRDNLRGGKERQEEGFHDQAKRDE